MLEPSLDLSSQPEVGRELSRSEAPDVLGRHVFGHSRSIPTYPDRGGMPADIPSDGTNPQAAGLKSHDLFAFLEPQIALPERIGGPGGVHPTQPDEDSPSPTPGRAGRRGRFVDAQTDPDPSPVPKLVLTRQIGLGDFPHRNSSKRVLRHFFEPARAGSKRVHSLVVHACSGPENVGGA